jgi:hypothetical protein
MKNARQPEGRRAVQPHAEYTCPPPLTNNSSEYRPTNSSSLSIHQPIGEMVTTSLELPINRIEGKLSPDIVSIQLEPTLITRKSSNYRRI